MAQDLNKFVQEQREKLEQFDLWWRLMHSSDPENYPMVMQTGNEGAWGEQLEAFDVAWLGDTSQATCHFRVLLGEVFKECGGQAMALRKGLEARGLSQDQAVDVLNRAVRAGVLGEGTAGNLLLRTSAQDAGN